MTINFELLLIISYNINKKMRMLMSIFLFIIKTYTLPYEYNVVLYILLKILYLIEFTICFMVLKTDRTGQSPFRFGPVTRPDGD